MRLTPEKTVSLRGKVRMSKDGLRHIRLRTERGKHVWIQQRTQGSGPDAGGGAPEEMAAVD